MNIRYRDKFIGKRMWKTAISVYITAVICHYLQLPIIFAVIAAIISIDPTVRASIKKGMIRLPAAVMGAGVAMFFDFLFGQVPLSYALSALCIIYVCHLLKWHDAILIATLTAMVMIPLTEDHFLLAFLIRSGTTSIGIIVSTLVNLLIWTPNFRYEIQRSFHLRMREMQGLIEDSLSSLWGKPGNKRLLEYRFSRLLKGIEQLSEFIFYEREEQRFRWKTSIKTSSKDIMKWQKSVNQLRQLSFHVGDLLAMKGNLSNIPAKEKDHLKSAWASINTLFDQVSGENIANFKTESILESPQDIHNLYHILHMYTDDEHLAKELPPVASIAYELLAIHAILTDEIYRRKN